MLENSRQTYYKSSYATAVSAILSSIATMINYNKKNKIKNIGSFPACLYRTMPLYKANQVVAFFVVVGRMEQDNNRMG